MSGAVVDEYRPPDPHPGAESVWSVDPLLRNVRLAPGRTGRGDEDRARQSWFRYGPVRPFRVPAPPGTRRARAELAAALERREFRLEFQPIVAVTGGRLEGFEALLRWRHPRRGVLRPGDFLGEAEGAGALRHVTPFVLGAACEAAARWNVGAPHDLAVSINLSGSQLRQPELTELVAAALDEHELDPSRLWFEIDENTGAREARSRLGTLLELRRLGTRLALDDFGTGWASIGCLRDLPVDAVKIDHSLVQQSDTRRGARVLAACADIAHALGIATVAEGIETAHELALVRALGCEFGQGNYFGRPVPRFAADRTALLGWPWPLARSLSTAAEVSDG